ncbi:MAG: response regulator [Armatimonadetes bacterium]|nr:response regulator [Armatimonadota bacterium]
MTEQKKRRKILIVDDDPDIVSSLSNYLELEGFEVLRAGGGKEALEMIKEPNLDIIALDIMMPDVDGFQVIENLRRDPKTAQIPVIFLTAKTADEDVLKGWQKGAASYITKPFNFAELVRAVELIFETGGKAQKERTYDL